MILKDDIEIVNDFLDDSVLIKNLRSEITNNNVIKLFWDWPPLKSNINVVYVFSANDNAETLKELFERNASYEAIPRSAKNFEGSNYSYTLEDREIMFKLFPAIFVDGYQKIFEQKEQNVTTTFLKRTSVKRKVHYSGGLLGSVKKVEFLFRNTENFKTMPDDALLYCVYSNTAEAYYPLDLNMAASGNYAIYIDKHFKADIVCNDKYDGAVVIQDF